MKNAVTIIELLIVIVIIGILSAIAIPLYTNRVEQTYGERAIANIEVIASAMKMYNVKYNDLYRCTNGGYIANFPTAAGANSNLAQINNDLNLNLSDDNFYYNVNLDGLYDEILVIRRDSGVYRGFKLMYSFNPSLNREGWSPANWYNPVWPWEPTQPAF